MASQTTRRVEQGNGKTVASMIREAIEKAGYKDVKECARGIRVPYDLFNKVVGGHLPKDAQLVEYAKKLKVDHRELILAAYREKAQEDMKGYFNSVNLLENHKPEVAEMLEIVDECNRDQLEELLRVGRLILASPRDQCRKATALLGLYQQLEPDVMEHFDGLVMLALRNENPPGLKAFQNSAHSRKNSGPPRRGGAKH